MAEQSHTLLAPVCHWLSCDLFKSTCSCCAITLTKGIIGMCNKAMHMPANARNSHQPCLKASNKWLKHPDIK